MKRLKIAIDCDGVLSDFVGGALRLVEEITGRRFVPTDVTERDFLRALGFTPREAIAVKKAIGARRGFAASLAPYPHARRGVRRLRELGAVFCVTAPWATSSWWCAERTAWLALHFGIDVVHHDVVKSSYEADVFVDDTSAHVRDWAAAWPGRVAVFWRTPHNTSESVPVGAHSISSWDALYQLAREAATGPIQLSSSMREEITS